MTTPHDPASAAGRSDTTPGRFRLTADRVAAALTGLGLPGLTPGAIAFPTPITRQGPAWRVDIELPLGVPAAKVTSRPGQLAAGLGLPPERVWLDGQPGGSARRLVLRVFDEIVTVDDEAARYFRLGPGCRYDPAGDASVCNCPVAHRLLAALTRPVWHLLPDRAQDWVMGLPCWLQEPAAVVIDPKGTGNLDVFDDLAARRHATTMRRLRRVLAAETAVLLALVLTTFGLAVSLLVSHPTSPAPTPVPPASRVVAPVRSPALPVPPSSTATGGPVPGQYVPHPAGTPADQPQP